MLPIISCAGPPPRRPVQIYLRLLTGEQPYSERLFESITTQHYRTTQHPHLLSITRDINDESVDLVNELRNDDVLVQVFNLVTWETTYEETELSQDEARVVARVIMTERKPGDIDKALKIEGLYEEIREILESGLELPFIFELKREDGKWKIDDFQFPEKLLSLLDLTGLTRSR